MYAVAGALTGIGVQLGNLGLHSANTYFAARDRGLLQRLAGNSLLISATLGAIAVAVLWCLAFLRPDIAPLGAPLLALVSAAIPIGLAYLLLQNLLIGVQEVRAFNRIEIITRLVSLTLIAFVILEKGVSPAALFAAGVAASAVGLARVLRRLRGLCPGVPRPSPGLLRAHLVYGVKSYLACLFGYLVVRFDLLMVQHMLGMQQAGFYSIAASMADLVYLLPSVIGTLLFPKLVARETREEKWRLTTRVGGLVLALMIGVSGGAALVARPMIRLLFGNDFLPAAPAFVLLAIAMIFYGVNNIVSNYLAALALPWFSVVIWMVICALNIGLNLLWIPAYGIVGASLSSLVCYVLVLVAQVVYCARWRPGAC